MKKNYISKKGKRMTQKLMLAALASTLCATPVVFASAVPDAGYAVELADTVVINQVQGWQESASVAWQPVAGAEGYNVYYKAETEGSYKQLDSALIRQYPNYFRADAIGLPEGSYIMKVVPIFAESEETSKEAVTQSIAVQAFTREGFAFSKASPMGTGSGGYNDDGSISKEAQIVYITADTVNDVALDVVTNSKGTTTTCTGLVNILAARQKGYDKRPLIIRMVGTVKDSDISGLNSNGYIQLKGCYNLTFEGVGEDATAYGWGFLIRDAHNLELRNIGVMLFKDDAISLDTGNENIWIHNNDVFYGTAGSDKDQAKGDGSCDIKGFSNYVTVSYNHFWDSGKCSLCGMSDSKEFFVTYHHNWYDHSDSRHPRIRVGSIHIYNNYFDGNAKYGVGITKGGSAFVEANDFRNCKYPMLISLQGSDIANGNLGTFSKEPGGMIKAYNNQIAGAEDVIYHTEDEKEFDAYLAASRDEKVPDTYQSVSGNNTYNNFDTNAAMYEYTPDAPQDVRAKVTAYAGRVNGGDFKWTFTEADDKDYGLNKELMAAIRSYQSQIISIGGGSVVVPGNPETEKPETENPAPETPDANTPGTDEEKPGTSIEGNITHNFTESGKESAFFAINGNLSTSKGSVTYNEMTLTTCLKLESSTSIKFALDKPASLTLVLDNGFSKNVVIDGVKYKASEGMLTVDLAEGEHTITKGDTANLFFVSINTDNVQDENGSMENDTNKENEDEWVPGIAVELSTSGSAASPVFTLQFDGNTEAVQLSDLAVRYYFTKEDGKDMNLWCDYAGLALDEAPWHVDLTSAAAYTFGQNEEGCYVDIAVNGNETAVRSGKLTLQVRMANSDWSEIKNMQPVKTAVIYKESVL